MQRVHSRETGSERTRELPALKVWYRLEQAVGQKENGKIVTSHLSATLQEHGSYAKRDIMAKARIDIDIPHE